MESVSMCRLSFLQFLSNRNGIKKKFVCNFHVKVDRFKFRKQNRLLAPFLSHKGSHTYIHIYVERLFFQNLDEININY